MRSQLTYIPFVVIAAFLLRGATNDLQNIHPSTSSWFQEQAARDVIKRVISGRHSEFLIQVQSSTSRSNDEFEVYWDEGRRKIVTIGNTAVAALFGLNQYLKYHCKCMVAWEGEQLRLPQLLPRVKIKQTIHDRFRYYQNPCQGSYSFTWWDWPEWEKHIDWMALNGINLSLAFEGQEAIWLRVYQSFGLTREHILNEFFTGPAFLAWWRTNNIRRWGGPLPISYMERKLALLKKIVARMRQLGMTPVLPAFAGGVPPGLAKFPRAHIVEHYAKWNNFNESYSRIHMVQPMDPLFLEIGRRFIQEMSKELNGTDHVYSCDPFIETQPHENNPTYLSHLAQSTYASMAAADSKAVWLLQSWMFKYVHFWKWEQVESFLKGVAHGKLILLDTEAELFPRYRLFNSYFNHSFIWCLLHNYGDTHGMYGVQGLVNDGVLKARRNSSSLVGTGLCPEGIHHNNYFIYDFMSEASLRNDSVNLAAWVSHYQRRRYGVSNENLNTAWTLLQRTVYDAPSPTRFHGRTVVTRRPGFKIVEEMWYDPADIVMALEKFIVTAEDDDNWNFNSLFYIDLVDLTRQLLQVSVYKSYQMLLASYMKKDQDEFENSGSQILEALDDMELILATNEHFLFGPRLTKAEEWGTTAEEKSLIRFNVLNQITLWGPEGELVDYSAKMWSGMFSNYYKPRWSFFLSKARQSWTDPLYSYVQYKHEIITTIEQPFGSNNFTHFFMVPQGNSLKEAKRILLKYKAYLNDPANYARSDALFVLVLRPGSQILILLPLIITSLQQYLDLISSLLH